MKKSITFLFLFAACFIAKAQNEFPEPRTGHSIVLVGDYIYMFGGESVSKNSTKSIFLNDLSEYAPIERGWVKKNPSGPTPTGRSGHSACTHEQRMYVLFGETSDGLSNEVWGYNPATNQWEQKTLSGASIEARKNHATVTVGNNLYVFGGNNGTQEFSNGYVIDMTTWNATALPAVPAVVGSSGASMVNVNQKPVVVGGWNDQGATNGMIWINTPGVMSWSVGSLAGQGFGYAGSASAEGSAWFCGGSTSSKNEGLLNKLYRIDALGFGTELVEISSEIPPGEYFNTFVVNLNEPSLNQSVDTAFYFWGGVNNDSFYKFTLASDENEETLEIYNPDTQDWDTFVPASIQNISKNESLSIYPNPTSDKIFIDYKGVTNFKSIKIFNIAGQVVLSNDYCLSGEVNVSNLSKGLYFVEIDTQTHNFKIKFIKE